MKGKRRTTTNRGGNPATAVALVRYLLVLLCVSISLVSVTVAHPSPKSGEAEAVHDPMASARKVNHVEADPNWLATIQKNLEAGEYRPSKEMTGIAGEKVEEPAWLINNRAQGFRSLVSKGGWEIMPLPPRSRIDPKDPTKKLVESSQKTDESSKWYWRYRLSGVSRGGKRTTLSSPEMRDEADTVHLRHSSSLREWYKNSKAGIEQGFEILEKPHVKGRAELVLIGEVKTDLTVRNATREKIGFFKDSAEVIQYAGLKVSDAHGKIIPSWLSYSVKSGAKRLLIHIDDAQAVYPLMIDPLATSPAWTGESNQSNSFYGWRVSSAGDVNGDGYSDVLVGAEAYSNMGMQEGRVYLYEGSASGLATTAAWTGESGQSGAFYGSSVSTAGDVNGDGYSDVIIGARLFDNGETNEGQAYLYLGSAAGLSPMPAWTGESDQEDARYGFSVGTAGDVNGDGFSDVLVGAFNFSQGQLGEGGAFLYLGSALGLATTPAWTGEGNQVGASFGYSLGTAGDVNGDGYSDVVVSAYAYSNGEFNEGQVYVYHGSGAGLATSPAWTTESNQAGAYYGNSVGTAGDINDDGFSDVVVGSSLYDNGESDEGRVYVYLGSASGLLTTASWTAESDQVDAYYGGSVSSAGDVNGDGYADVLIGARGFDNGEMDEGKADLFLGAASGLSSSAAWTGESDQGGSLYGVSVATAGDVNGDGAADVVIGASGYTNGQASEGRAFLYLGIPEPTPPPTPTPTPTSTPTPTFTHTPTATPQSQPTEIGKIEIDLSRSNLLPPIVRDLAPVDAVEISVPYDFSYSPAFLKKVRAFLQKALKKRKMTDTQVIAQLNRNRFFSYTLTPVGVARLSSSDRRAEYAALAARAKVIKIRSRRNLVTVGRLTPGQTYSVTYQMRFEFKGYKKTFATKTSDPTILTKR